MTETGLAELLSKDLSGLDVVLMADGHISPGPAIWWVALQEGSTENAALVPKIVQI